MQARKFPRIKAEAPGSCKSARGFTWDIKIDDLSVGGCRVDDPRHGLELGAHIEVMIAETGPYTAEVAWRQGDRVGLQFLTPIEQGVFDLLVSGQWEAAQRAFSSDDRPVTSIRFPVRRIM